MPFARDLLSSGGVAEGSEGRGYDGPAEELIEGMLSGDIVTFNIPAGGGAAYGFDPGRSQAGAIWTSARVVSPPFDAPDDVAGSDLTAHERAWQRAVYYYVRTRYGPVRSRGRIIQPGEYSVSVYWYTRSRWDIAHDRRVARVTLFPWQTAPEPPGPKTQQLRTPPHAAPAPAAVF